MPYNCQAQWDTLRSAGTASIGATYATIGSALTNRALVVAFINNTNGDVVVSTDGTNDMMYFPANSYRVWDLRTNAPTDTDYLLSIGTQFYVKDGTSASSSGTFYIEILSVRTA